MLENETPLSDMINDAIWSSIVKYGHLDSNKVLIAASLSTGIELNTIETHYNYYKIINLFLCIVVKYLL